MGFLEKEVAQMTMRQIRKDMRSAVMMIKEIHPEAYRIKELLLEEMAIKTPW